ncbi:Transcription initiation factor TFIID subunit 5 [Hypsibius exemplaris]|uniref:Transcription initiation factor TFIID subunit 5 n=1 Tax=Hypsibius exemplaris TaxID=2072580 RepID=A0A1W0WT14_HYPEX|nr:Transcription initiation factor TFIID subunit 5 [Hypsibius exemplaris]
MASDKDRETLASVLAFLRSRGLKDTEEQLRREAGEELISIGDEYDSAMEVSNFSNAANSEEPVENETTILNINKAKVYHGIPKEPEITIPPELFADDEDDTDEEDKEPATKRRKGPNKKDFYARKFRSDPNAPPSTRVPFPPLSDLEKQDKLSSWKEAFKSARLGADRLPCICGYTLMNADSTVCTAGLSDDSSLLASGYSDSKIRIHSVTHKKLRAFKPAPVLKELDREGDDVMEQMFDNTTASVEKTIHCPHAGAIYSTSFSPDRRFLLAGCGDGSIRLWSLWLWTNLVNYKCHMYPVSDVEFSPLGHYFASCGTDRVGRLWSTESITPLRLFIGHNDDLTKIHFHPNSNYVATASADRTVRMWDAATGTCVRYFTGHKDVPQALCFSRCGKYLASGGRDGGIHIWDVAMAKEVLELEYHTKPVYALCFSRDNTLLASSGHDGNVALWNYKGLADQYQADNVSFGASGGAAYLVRSYATKRTSVMNLHFTRRNILLAVGKYGEL